MHNFWLIFESFWQKLINLAIILWEIDENEKMPLISFTRLETRNLKKKFPSFKKVSIQVFSSFLLFSFCSKSFLKIVWDCSVYFLIFWKIKRQLLWFIENYGKNNCGFLWIFVEIVKMWPNCSWFEKNREILCFLCELSVFSRFFLNFKIDNALKKKFSSIRDFVFWKNFVFALIKSKVWLKKLKFFLLRWKFCID